MSAGGATFRSASDAHRRCLVLVLRTGGTCSIATTAAVPLAEALAPWPFLPGNQLFSFRAGFGAGSDGASFFGRPPCG